MIEIKPMINTLPRALEYMGTHPSTAFLKHVVSEANPSADNIRSSYVLSGGSRNHPVSVSLIYSHTQRIFQDSAYRIRNREFRRLIIKDGNYRTRYAIDSAEYADILEGMEKFAQRNKLPLIDRTNHGR